MKLFSRKALVAGATALSVAFAGTTVANAEDTTSDLSSKITNSVENLSSSDNKDASDKEGESKNEDTRTSKQKADDIKAWIGVVTAVIGALGTLFAFANKYFDLPFGNK